jgi:hypothetical protein
MKTPDHTPQEQLQEKLSETLTKIKSTGNRSLTFFQVLTLLLIYLKLTGTISAGWLFIIAPLAFQWLFVTVIAAVVFVIIRKLVKEDK